MKRLSESESSSTIYGNYYYHNTVTRGPHSTLVLVSNIVARSGELMTRQTGLFGNHLTCVVAATETCIQGRYGMYCVFVCRVTSEC